MVQTLVAKTPNKAIPTQRFNEDWLQNEKYNFVKRAIKLDSSKQECKDDQGNVIHDEKSIKCESLIVKA